MSLLGVLRPLRRGMLAGLASLPSVREPLVLSHRHFLYFATHTEPQLAPHSPVMPPCCFFFGDVRTTESADARLAPSEPQKHSIGTKVNVHSAMCVLGAALPPGSGVCPLTRDHSPGQPHTSKTPKCLSLSVAAAAGYSFMPCLHLLTQASQTEPPSHRDTQPLLMGDLHLLL